MKKLLILFCGLFMIPVLTQAQQDKETANKDRSLTISVAPAFFATLDERLDADSFWPTSLYVTKNFPFKKRLSFSIGIHLLYKKMVEEGRTISDIIPGYSGPVKTTNIYSIFDIPLRLNYHILKPNDKTNIYAKTEIKNSLIANYIKSEPDMNGKYGSHTEYGYNMFFGIGFGFDFKVIDRLSIVVEPGISYSVTGMMPDVGLIDCQFGIKYALTKK